MTRQMTFTQDFITVQSDSGEEHPAVGAGGPTGGEDGKGNQGSDDSSIDDDSPLIDLALRCQNHKKYAVVPASKTMQVKQVVNRDAPKNATKGDKPPKAESPNGNSEASNATRSPLSDFKYDYPFVMVNVESGEKKLLEERGGQLIHEMWTGRPSMYFNFKPEERDVRVPIPKWVLVDVRTGRKKIIDDDNIEQDEENYPDMLLQHMANMERWGDMPDVLAKAEKDLRNAREEIASLKKDVASYQRIDEAKAKTKEQIHDELRRHMSQFPDKSLAEQKARLLEANKFRLYQLNEVVSALSREREDKRRSAELARERVVPLDLNDTGERGIIPYERRADINPYLVSTEELTAEERAQRKAFAAEEKERMSQSSLGPRPFRSTLTCHMTQYQRERQQAYDWCLSYRVECRMLSHYAPEAYQAEEERKKTLFEEWCRSGYVHRMFLREEYNQYRGPLYYKSSDWATRHDVAVRQANEGKRNLKSPPPEGDKKKAKTS